MTGKGTGDRSIPAWSWSLTAAASSLGVSARKNGTHPELACAAVRPIVRAAHQVSVSLSQTAQRWSHAVSMAAAMVLADVRGREKVLVYGQVVVLAGGQLKVPIPRSSCQPGV
jgi:hypothetical protein